MACEVKCLYFSDIQTEMRENFKSNNSQLLFADRILYSVKLNNRLNNYINHSIVTLMYGLFI